MECPKYRRMAIGERGEPLRHSSFRSCYAAEVDKFSPELRAGLEAKGVKLSSGFGAEGSGLHGVEVTPQGLRGGADPRREGVAKAP